MPVESDGQSVTLRVADTGPGVPAEHRPRIFEKSFRVSASASPSGAGLGLSINRDIVEAHGGTISFICPDTGASVFSISLPVFTTAAKEIAV